MAQDSVSAVKSAQKTKLTNPLLATPLKNEGGHATFLQTVSSHIQKLGLLEKKSPHAIDTEKTEKQPSKSLEKQPDLQAAHLLSGSNLTVLQTRQALSFIKAASKLDEPGQKSALSALLKAIDAPNMLPQILDAAKIELGLKKFSIETIPDEKNVAVTQAKFAGSHKAKSDKQTQPTTTASTLETLLSSARDTKKISRSKETDGVNAQLQEASQTAKTSLVKASNMPKAAKETTVLQEQKTQKADTVVKQDEKIKTAKTQESVSAREIKNIDMVQASSDMPENTKNQKIASLKTAVPNSIWDESRNDKMEVLETPKTQALPPQAHKVDDKKETVATVATEILPKETKELSPQVVAAQKTVQNTQVQNRQMPENKELQPQMTPIVQPQELQQISQTIQKEILPQEPTVKRALSLSTLLQAAKNEKVEKGQKESAAAETSGSTQPETKDAKSEVLSGATFSMAAIETLQRSSTDKKESKSQENISSVSQLLGKTAANTNEQLAEKMGEAKLTLSRFADDLKEQIDSYKPPMMKISMQLNPENMGAIDVTMISRGNQLIVRMNAAQDTLAMFMNNTADFRDQMTNFGFVGLQMNFSFQEQSQQRDQNGRQRTQRIENYKQANNTWGDGLISSVELSMNSPKYA